MHKKLIFMGVLAGLSIVPALAAEMAPVVYDDTWYRGDFWGGEYPDGLSVTADTEVMIRADTDLALPRDIACTLEKNATYHVWNLDRVASDNLAFVGYTRISTATLTSDFTTMLDPDEGGDSVDISFKKGETYNYLTYYGEGAFLLDYKGVRYVAYADLWDVSDFSDPETAYHEWLGLDCVNGTSGWLFMDEVRGMPGIEDARVPQWGMALDLDVPEPAEFDGELGE